MTGPAAKRGWRWPLRSVDIGAYHDAFLISAAATIITIRLQLWATNYPELGGGKLHFAHLLWGGLAMVLTIVFLISTVGRRPVLPAAILGGIGFGFFIDEVGKFVTKDNDYFFQPTAAIIYIAFVVLYLGLRWIRTRVGFSHAEHLHNAMELLGGASDRHLTEVDRNRALRELELAGGHPMVPGLRAAAEAAPIATDLRPSLPVRIAAAGRAFYFRQAERPGFPRLVRIAVATWTLLNVLAVVGLVLTGFGIGETTAPGEDSLDHLNFGNWATLVATVVSVGFAIAGFREMRRGEFVRAYSSIDRALLVNLFFTQAFIFAESSFSATTGFIVALVLWIMVRYMLARETRRGYNEPEAIPDVL